MPRAFGYFFFLSLAMAAFLRLRRCFALMLRRMRTRFCLLLELAMTLSLLFAGLDQARERLVAQDV